MKLTLGLDASTTVIGWSFYDPESKKILGAGFVDISKKETNKEKAFFFIEFITKNPLIKEVSKITMESALMGFTSGFTKQQTIVLLARWNGIFEYILSEHFKMNITLVNVNTARKKVFGKCRVKGIPAKEYVKMSIPNVVPYISDFEVKNKKGAPDKRNADVYDAIVISMY